VQLCAACSSMVTPSPHAAGPATARACCLLRAAPKLILTEPERRRLDESADAAFYASPRTMQHAEPQFIAAVTGEAPVPAIWCLHVLQLQAE
jgi:hypothetical protein